MAPAVYVFDTSAIEQLRSYYPKQFPTFWKHLDSFVDSGRVLSVREVQRELEGRTRPDWLAEWLKKRAGIFLTPGAEETAFVAEIFRVPHFQQLVRSTERLKGTPVADPFLIAAAKVRQGCVVTQEVRKENAAKIPNVCDHFGIDCRSFEEFMSENGWSY